MSEQIRELTTHEPESVVGAVGGWAFTALNPQPIPPGYTAWGLFYTPGCPGPNVIPPTPI